MEKRRLYFVPLVVGLGLILFLAGFAYGGSGGIISKEELIKELENPNVVVLDVRTGRDWKSSEFKIKGAVRANPNEFDAWWPPKGYKPRMA